MPAKIHPSTAVVVDSVSVSVQLHVTHQFALTSGHLLPREVNGDNWFIILATCGHLLPREVNCDNNWFVIVAICEQGVSENKEAYHFGA